MKGRALMLSGALLAMAIAPTAAQEIVAGGQIRPRFEYRDPGAAPHDWFTSMRVRANIMARLPENVSAFLQFQDVRTWGEEANTLTDFRADNLDLHQGYLQIRRPGALNLGARIGRQEVNLGGQRLVGAVGWTQQGRSFDGVRIGATGNFGTVTILGFQLADGTAPGITDDAQFAAAYASLTNIVGGTLDLYGLYDRVGATNTRRGTLGARLNGRQGRIAYRLEGSYQLGHSGALDVAAFMVGARLGTSFGRGTVTLWYDYLSGDDAPMDTKTNVFNTLFATNHKFYGFADLFIDIPTHTAGLGLQDAAIKGAFAATDDVSILLDVHHFRAAKTGPLTGGRFGEEIDLTARYRYSGNLTASFGASYVIQGPGLSEIGRLTDNMIFTYLMLDASF